MSQKNKLFRVAVASPLRRTFDYLGPGSDCHSESGMSFNFNAELNYTTIEVGMRVSVPFRGKLLVGIVLQEIESSDVATNKLRIIDSVLDTEPLLNAQDIKLLQWASHYYQHPIGEVIQASIPALLRQGKAANAATQKVWSLSELGQTQLQDSATSLKRSPKQKQIMLLFERYSNTGITEQDFATISDLGNWRDSINRLVKKQWLIESEQTVTITKQKNSAHNVSSKETTHQLNQAQQQAVSALLIALQQQDFKAFLLHGVTGSGKTEVYLQAAQACLAKQQQVLILVPEIGLTPQLISRFQQRLNATIVTSHSGLNDTQRLTAWLAFRNAQADILIGTRSAVFTPMQRPGLIIIDEEHDLSLKQQDGFRYSARDIAIMRARNLKIPIILGSATPSLESLYNVQQQRFSLLHLPERAGKAIPPKINIIDVRHLPMKESLSSHLMDRMHWHLEQGKQVILFLNRRGYSPTLMCHDCGWCADCLRCDKHMTIHLSANRLRCHHCGSERPIETCCPNCDSDNLLNIGHGTQRIEETLEKYFPQYHTVRIDRDNTRRKGALDKIFDEIHQGKHQILLGTQIIAKGHHFPDVTLVGIVDIDQGLFSADFRASERMAQLILQVSGRAGRAETPGEVAIQTHHPEHTFLQALINKGYGEFSKELLHERYETQFPPYTHLALLRAQATAQNPPQQFLFEAKQIVNQLNNQLECYGPFPAPMERRAGKFRSQLVILAKDRKTLHHCLTPLVQQLEMKKTNTIRWSIDVDPMEMF
ncbi:Helicase PriA essential for oriC/DnaA-independent DNA replication [hydrothermal vent metagenome]|uniref:DNA 3'-5' helicase n=1 Tax=hydrothermal vent metagenome TaxID=652676 RepID=A0A3B0ZBY8_9ZZZZ